MRLACYYILHTIVNGIKKIFRAWVAILIVSCLLFGILFGVVMGVIFSSVEGGEPPASEVEEVVDAPEIDTDALMNIIELIAGGVIFGALIVFIYTGDKSGGDIFLMADVNILFPAPRKPQSVLMFRTVMQMGAILVGSLYLIGQLPNLILNAGLTGLQAAAILFVWVFTLMTGKLVSVCTYTVSASHPGAKKFVRPLAIGLTAAIAAAFLIFYRLTDQPDVFTAAKAFFNAPATRYIPLWGWLKGGLMFVFEGRWAAAAACFASSLALCAALAYGIWQIKADFYEDAFSKAAVRQEKLEAAAEGRRARFKPRKERERPGLSRGEGAGVFFARTMYLRRCTLFCGVLTRTGVTYLALSVGTALITRVIGSATVVPMAAVLAASLFFRSFASPVAGEGDLPYLPMIPERAGRKIAACVLGGAVDNALDLLPAVLVGALVLRADPLDALVAYGVLLTFESVCSCAGLFLDLALPKGWPVALRTMLYFSLKGAAAAPALILLAAGGIFGFIKLALILLIPVNLAFAGFLFMLSPGFLHAGRA